ncbi:MAG: putative multi-sensor signal transduction histidine kinase [Acidimicrobiales bacterium]|nr:putative multi-sensor signal transduction histidine kinase [Acidimicrobiales bacterium]
MTTQLDVTAGQGSEAKFRALLEAAPDAIVGVNADGRIALVNAQTERLFGYGREELLGQPVEILVPDSLREIHLGHRNTYLNGPVTRPMGAGMELAGRRKDGSEFPAEISLSAIETEDGLLVSAAIRDVSDRRQAAEAQARLAAIIHSSHDAIIGKTVDGVITSWNPGAQRLYGYTTGEVVGKHVNMLVPVERRDEERAILGRIGRGERIEQYHNERIRKDGTVVTVSTTMSPIADTTGAIVGMASVSRDIGERLRAEAQFLGLLEAARDAVVCVGADGRIALLNAQAELLFGYDRDELVGEPMELLVPERSRANHRGLRTGYFADPKPRPIGMELSGRRKDGTEFPAEITLSPLETDEGILVSATVRDVSERLEAQAERDRLKAQADRVGLESQLHQSQRLESLGQLAGGVAHDFNNLLAVILNYSYFVEEEITAAASESGGERWGTAAADLEQIRRAAERATGLTRQLLAFGRREVVRPQVLNLNAVVRDVELLLRRTIGEEVELATSLDNNLWPVLADPGQMEQVLVNLAVNARDAMPTGGTVSIETKNVDIDDTYAAQKPGLTSGPHVRLRVSDTGTGMESEVLGRAFEPFFTTKPKGEGSGLGLPTVYGIVTQAGGHALIHSQRDVGTTFTALLPATEELASPGEEPAPTHRPRGGETVLVVEDEDAMREVTRRILARNGYDVLTAAGGTEAMALANAREDDIDLLLTDVVMPNMLGKEVATRLVALRPGLRVLYMSGYAQPVLASKGTLDAGVNLLEKPFFEPVLLARVREVLDVE